MKFLSKTQLQQKSLVELNKLIDKVRLEITYGIRNSPKGTDMVDWSEVNQYVEYATLIEQVAHEKPALVYVYVGVGKGTHDKCSHCEHIYGQYEYDSHENGCPICPNCKSYVFPDGKYTLKPENG